MLLLSPRKHRFAEWVHCHQLRGRKSIVFLLYLFESLLTARWADLFSIASNPNRLCLHSAEREAHMLMRRGDLFCL